MNRRTGHTPFGRERARRARRGRASLGTLLGIGAGVWIALLVGTTARGVWRGVELSRSVEALRADSLRVAAAIDSLDLAMRTQDASREQERILRENMGLVRPGEIVFRVRHEAATGDSGR